MNKATQDDITKRIKDTLEDAEITAKDLSAIIGVDRKQIRRWKNGEQEMGIFKLATLCSTLGISADYLLGLPSNLTRPR